MHTYNVGASERHRPGFHLSATVNERPLVSSPRLTKMSSILDQLIGNKMEREKFENLERYFQNFNVEDLLELDNPFELLADVEPADRLAMRLLLQKYLIPIFEDHYQRLKGPKIINSGRESKIFASGALISQFSKDDKKRMNISRFTEWVLKNVPNGSKIVYIDISGNELLFADLENVLKMIEAFEKKYLLCANGLIIDLQNNRIYCTSQYQGKVDATVYSIANHGCVTFVDFRSNPIVYNNLNDFFRKLSLKLLVNVTAKLIWIHEFHLQTDGWHTLVFCNKQLQELLIKRHNEYFALRNTYKMFEDSDVESDSEDYGENYQERSWNKIMRSTK